MKIHEQISKYNYILSRTYDLYTAWAKKFNLTCTSLFILYSLFEKQTCTQKQVCNLWSLPKQTVHSESKKLEKEQLLTITTNDTNKRERLLSFTEKGLLLAEKTIKPLYQKEEMALIKLNEEKTQQLIDRTEDFYLLLKEEIENDE